MSQSKSPSAVIINELGRIRTVLARLEQEEASSRQAFQSLYKEMEYYKEDCMLSIQNLLLQDLLRFHDSLAWFRETLQETENSTALQENFSHVFDEFSDLLHDRSITALPQKTVFDASIHRVVEIIPTEKQELHNTIKAVVKRGFQRQEQVLRFEEVVIYQYQT